MATLTSLAFVTAVIAELAAAVEAVGGSPVTSLAPAALPKRGWAIPLTFSGSVRGSARLVLDEPGVTGLLLVVHGTDADTGEASARDLLHELTNQAISAARLKAPFARVVATAGSIAAAPLQGDETAICTLSGTQMTLHIAAAATDAAIAAGAPTDSSLVAPASPALPQPGTAASAALPANLDVVLDIELPLSVRFGSTVMSIRALSALGPGSIVDMGRAPDEPVDILVCGRPIARAEVVIVGGNYGVRITDLTSAAERLRAMEGQL